MAREAVGSALTDAGLQYPDVQAVVASYCYGDPACGQRAVYGETAQHPLHHTMSAQVMG